MNNLSKILSSIPFNQADLARASGLSTNKINTIFNNNRFTGELRTKTKVKIVNALNHLVGSEKYTVEDVFPEIQ